MTDYGPLGPPPRPDPVNVGIVIVLFATAIMAVTAALWVIFT